MSGHEQLARASTEAISKADAYRERSSHYDPDAAEHEMARALVLAVLALVDVQAHILEEMRRRL